MLGRHTVYQADLGASAAELVMGQCPKVPGDIARSDDPANPDLSELLLKLRTNAAKPPIQTSFHKNPPVYWPTSAEKATHVYVLKG